MEERQVLSAAGGEVMLFSVGGAGLDLPNGQHADSADVIQYDGSDFEILFDGSDVGLDGANIDAVAYKGDDQFLFSFASATEIGGVTYGTSDIVLFEADSLGEDTAGRFSLFVGGNDLAGSDPSYANIDGIDLSEDGTLYFSLLRQTNLSVGTVRGEDIVQVTPDASGSYANGTMELLFDGSDVGLSFSSENTNAISLNGSLLQLSTVSTSFIDSQGLSGSMDDVLTFAATTDGEQITGFGHDTEGTFALTFDGSIELNGFRFDLNGLDYAELSQASNPPTAEDVDVILDEDTTASVQLLGDDGDPDFDQALTYQIVEGPDFGVVENFDASTGTFTYTPNADFHGTDELVYLVQDVDSNGVVSTSELAVVSFTVNSVNDAPAVLLEQTEFTGNEDVPLVIQGVSVRDLEAEAQNAPVTVTLTAANGRLTLPDLPGAAVDIVGNGNGEITLVGTIVDINALLAEGVTYTPDTDFSGNTSVGVTIRDEVDSESGLESTGNVQIEIRSMNQQARELRDRLNRLVESRELGRGEAQRLLNTVKPGGRVDGINRGLRHIDKLERQGRLDPDLAEELRDRLNDIKQGAEEDSSASARPRGIDEIFSEVGRGDLARRLARLRFSRR